MPFKKTTNNLFVLSCNYIITRRSNQHRFAFGTIIKNTEGLVTQIIFKMVNHNEELSYIGIIQITSLTEGTIKSYLSRARKVLQINLLLTYKRDYLS
ncbi:hypothetical protein DBR11_03450 [Pedobacter sp. HMWF019]|nr:hypothetical protein DBR11_03450 [Pedobacter sp. HMWF019]